MLESPKHNCQDKCKRAEKLDDPLNLGPAEAVEAPAIADAVNNVMAGEVQYVYSVPQTTSEPPEDWITLASSIVMPIERELAKYTRQLEVHTSTVASAGGKHLKKQAQEALNKFEKSTLRSIVMNKTLGREATREWVAANSTVCTVTNRRILHQTKCGRVRTHLGVITLDVKARTVSFDASAPRLLRIQKIVHKANKPALKVLEAKSALDALASHYDSDEEPAAMQGDHDEDMGGSASEKEDVGFEGLHAALGLVPAAYQDSSDDEQEQTSSETEGGGIVAPNAPVELEVLHD